MYYTDSFKNENPVLIQTIEQAGFKLEQILTKQLEKISFTQSPAGIAAVCNFPNIGNPDINQNKRLYKSFFSKCVPNDNEAVRFVEKLFN